MAKRRTRGEGSLTKDSRGYWTARIFLPDGTRKTKRSRSQTEVREWLQQQRESVRDSTWVSDDSVTLGKFLEQWLEEVARPSIRPRTFEAYSGWCHSHIIPGLGRARLVDLTPRMVQHFYNTRLSSGLAPRSVLHIHRVLHKALEQAVRWSLVPRNVTDLVTPPAVERFKPVLWTLDELRRFMETAAGHRLHALFVLAVACGLRQGELLGLQIGDIQWDTGSLHVRHALQYLRRRGSVLSSPKTSTGYRTVKVPASALAILRRHVEAEGREEGYVFLSRAETPIQPRPINDVFHALVRKAGVSRIRFHDLRHLCATLHLKNGTHPSVVAQLLGHSTITLTLNTYSHVMPAMQDDAAERMDKLLAG
jgi:integrase